MTRGELAELFEAAARPHGRAAAPALAARDALLEGFKPSWLLENQKFDFSFSSAPDAGLRFSYNDHGEEDGFRAKLERCLASFRGAYRRDLWEAVLDAAEELAPGHQRNFGLDWPAGCPAPRLKLYFFEEPGRRLQRAGRVKLARAVARAAAVAWPRGSLETSPPAALGVDFLPDGRLFLKAYALVPPRARGAFHYLMQRRDEAGRLVSLKTYRIFAPGLAPGRRDAAAGAFLEHCRQRGLRPSTVASSLDLTGRGPAVVGRYYTVKGGAA